MAISVVLKQKKVKSVHSRSPISNIVYDASSVSEKSKNLISKITNENKDKLIVGVQGLGFVGAASASVIAGKKNQFTVIGFEANNEIGLWKIGDVLNGILPIDAPDEKLNQYFSNSCGVNLCATSDETYYSICDVILVDINLDVQKTENKYDITFDHFKKGIRSIFRHCRAECLVIVETTVPPGTCENIILPIAKEEFQKRSILSEPKIGHSYERVTPGPNYVNSIENFYRVYSGVDDVSKKETKSFLSKIINVDDFPLTELQNTNSSELAKVLENSYRAANIAFIDEWAKFAEIANVDLYDVIQAIKMRPTHNNIMKPGLGVGGYCLTKDPLLASWASKHFFNGEPLHVSEKSVLINDRMPLHTSRKVLDYLTQHKIKKGNILILGVSYLNDISDTRSSPTEILYDELLKTEHSIYVHDPIVKYWAEKDMFIENKIQHQHFDVVILAVGHREYTAQYFWEQESLNSCRCLVDTMGYLKQFDFALTQFEDVITVGVGS